MSADRRVEAAEVAFFDEHYREAAYHPTANRLRQRREVRWVKSLIHGSNVRSALSVGCGAGEFELLLAPHVARLTGVDLSPAAIATARAAAESQGVKNVEFVCGALDDLPGDESFDLIACISFLHHVPACDVPAMLSALFAKLNSGGRICTQDPNRRGWLRWLGRRVLRRSYDTYHSPDERELDPRELKDQLQAAGFVDVRLGALDSTLIPAMYVLRRGPSWPFYVLREVDRAWTSTPLWRFASGFTAVARKP